MRWLGKKTTTDITDSTDQKKLSVLVTLVFLIRAIRGIRGKKSEMLTTGCTDRKTVERRIFSSIRVLGVIRGRGGS